MESISRSLCLARRPFIPTSRPVPGSTPQDGIPGGRASAPLDSGGAIITRFWRNMQAQNPRPRLGLTDLANFFAYEESRLRLFMPAFKHFETGWSISKRAACFHWQGKSGTK